MAHSNFNYSIIFYLMNIPDFYQLYGRPSGETGYFLACGWYTDLATAVSFYHPSWYLCGCFLKELGYPPEGPAWETLISTSCKKNIYLRIIVFLVIIMLILLLGFVYVINRCLVYSLFQLKHYCCLLCDIIRARGR